jgi:hypothetical protein
MQDSDVNIILEAGGLQRIPNEGRLGGLEQIFDLIYRLGFFNDLMGRRFGVSFIPDRHLGRYATAEHSDLTDQPSAAAASLSSSSSSWLPGAPAPTPAFAPAYAPVAAVADAAAAAAPTFGRVTFIHGSPSSWAVLGDSELRTGLTANATSGGNAAQESGTYMRPTVERQWIPCSKGTNA